MPTLKEARLLHRLTATELRLLRDDVNLRLVAVHSMAFRGELGVVFETHGRLDCCIQAMTVTEKRPA